MTSSSYDPGRRKTLAVIHDKSRDEAQHPPIKGGASLAKTAPEGNMVRPAVNRARNLLGYLPSRSIHHEVNLDRTRDGHLHKPSMISKSSNHTARAPMPQVVGRIQEVNLPRKIHSPHSL
jgi:hypothetical protein